MGSHSVEGLVGFSEGLSADPTPNSSPSSEKCEETSPVCTGHANNDPIGMWLASCIFHNSIWMKLKENNFVMN